MLTITQCNESDYATLAEIWKRSVLATHRFLTADIIAEIKQELIPTYFPAVSLYAACDNGVSVGFIGLSGDKIEMLFVDSIYLRHGYGSAMIEFAKKCGATYVDVNEQNPAALKFYETHGFRIVGRDNTDDAGRPYPILHMSLRPA